MVKHLKFEKFMGWTIDFVVGEDESDKGTIGALVMDSKGNEMLYEEGYFNTKQQLLHTVKNRIEDELGQYEKKEDDS